MNYIGIINEFWKKRRSVRLSSAEADVYFFLLQESNQRGWENPFSCPNTLACAIIGISEKTLISVRRRLQEKGFIDFESGKSNGKSPVYTLLTDQSGIEKLSNQSVGKFIKPNLNMIENYCKERENAIDPQTFYNFYQAKGWMIGANKMQDWKAAVRSWEQKQKMDSHIATQDLKKHYEQF